VYRLIAPLLMRLEPEASHDLALRALHWAGRAQLDSLMPLPVVDPVRRMGIRFPNRVGLAAGLDKNADCMEALGGLGFGFLEVGTVTPRPQPGNPRPRMFRIPEQQALINRMGFNNRGLDHLVRRIERRRYLGVLGVNIGRNRDTPAERALDDYRLCLEAVHGHADYVTLNLSSPNTPGLPDLQLGEALGNLLDGLAATRERLADAQGRRLPMLVKIAPDLHEDDVTALTGRLLESGVDGVIATNTTIERPGVESSPVAAEAGGLSGGPLHARSLEVVRKVRAAAGDDLCIIGVGGIDRPERAVAMIEAGADLVQLYTGFIYQGPALVRAAAAALATMRAGPEGRFR
jgi:dihydroorotate dehydrogenase